jgi:hypothetical protein
MGNGEHKPMAIVAPLSRYKRNSLLIAIVALTVFGCWCIYDAHFNESFIAKYTGEDGRPESELVFNLYAPPFLFGLALLAGINLFLIRNRQVVAADTQLIVNGKLNIPYDAIEQIDKTHFEKKGFFVLTYQQEGGREATVRLDDRKYDNLPAILDHLVAQIT